MRKNEKKMRKNKNKQILQLSKINNFEYQNRNDPNEMEISKLSEDLNEISINS